MDFTLKARWFKDRHRRPDPKESKYAGVVSRDNVIIDLNYSALNDVNMTSDDI